MSLDVFGRKLKGKGGEGQRGLPGVGFKLTSEGNYDLENSRLENLASPLQSNDAINLKTVQDMVQMAVDSMTVITARLRSDLDDLNTIIEAELKIKTSYKNGSSSGGATQTS